MLERRAWATWDGSALNAGRDPQNYWDAKMGWARQLGPGALSQTGYGGTREFLISIPCALSGAGPAPELFTVLLVDMELDQSLPSKRRLFFR